MREKTEKSAEIDHAEGNPRAVPVPADHVPRPPEPVGPVGPGGAYNPDLDTPETGDIKAPKGGPMIYDGVSEIPGLISGPGVNPPKKGSKIVW